MSESYTPEELQNQQLDPQPHINSSYNPNKRKRYIRRTLYQRYYWLRNDPLRVQAEADWETADKEFMMWTDTENTDSDNWHADLHLPDAFAAIQSQMQETIERTARPSTRSNEESDEPITEFCNDILNYNMDSTGYDYQYYLAKLNAASRGTAFLKDYWRTEKRTVKDPDSLDEKTGEIKYVEREIIDFDDDYTEWIPNEFIYTDDKANDINNAVDGIEREIINIEEFHRKYDKKPGFYDTQYVYQGGDTSDRSFFQLPKDITAQDVEVLHYMNRSTDSYWCCANNVTIYDAPLPSKHKELPWTPIYQYRIPGQFWGMGLPKILHMLSEERRSIRNLNMDRQKLNINKMFLHNSSFDIDDEDLISRPHGLISVDTGGQPLSSAIVPVEYGDVPASYFKTEEILLDDITRAIGINPLAEAQATGGTATQAAILKENTLKRINLISITNEMDSVVRIGKLKWSNISFFYPIPRMESITEDNEERTEKVYKTITVQGRKFDIKNENSKKVLKMDDVKGVTSIKLDKRFGRYLESSVDIIVDADIYTPISKAIDQTKKTEMFSLMLSQPETKAIMDMNGAAADVLKVNNVKPDVWLKNPTSKKDMMMLAEAENQVMMAGQPLAGTEDATEDHTLVHLMLTKTQEYQQSPPNIQQLVMDHILQEHDANPATGSSADLLSANGLQPQPAPAGPGVGAPVPPPGIQANTSQPQAQIADIQPTNFSQPE